MTRKNMRPMGHHVRPMCPMPPNMIQPRSVGYGGADNSMLLQQNLAMVYPVNQEFGDLYSLDAALCRGTLFKELDKPFCY